jgi:hypothetical protein
MKLDFLSSINYQSLYVADEWKYDIGSALWGTIPKRAS